MTQVFQRLTNRYVNILGAFVGLTTVCLILLHSGCGIVGNTPTIPVNQNPDPDTSRPTSAITSPTTGTNLFSGTTINITGTARDTGGGSVAKVDVSVDGGA